MVGPGLDPGDIINAARRKIAILINAARRKIAILTDFGG